MNPSQIIAAVCPALAESAELSIFVGMAAEQTDKGFFGKLYPYAVAYKACHLFEVSGIGQSAVAQAVTEASGGQRVASMSEGGLSVTFAQSGASADAGTSDFGSTKYGRLYLAILKTRPAMGVNMMGIGSL